MANTELSLDIIRKKVLFHNSIDVWISAWSISSAGTINPVAYDIGFMMRFEQKKNSGAEALLYQVKQSDGIN